MEKNTGLVEKLKKYKFIIAITLVGFFYRFWFLGSQPLWIDEALFYHYIEHGSNQEFLTVFIHIFLPKSEFWLRFSSALFGTLSIPATYYVIKDKKLAIIVSVFVAIFPLFVFWSRMARPYAVAAFFVILGWKNKYFYIPAILTTPYSLIGLNLTKIKNYKFYIIIISLAVLFFLIRPDSGRSFLNKEFLLNAKRLWYIPIITCCLYIFDFIIPYIRQQYGFIRKQRMV